MDSLPPEENVGGNVSSLPAGHLSELATGSGADSFTVVEGPMNSDSSLLPGGLPSPRRHFLGSLNRIPAPSLVVSPRASLGEEDRRVHAFMGIRADGSLVEAPSYVPVRETGGVDPQVDPWTRIIADPLEEGEEAWRPWAVWQKWSLFWGFWRSRSEWSDVSGARSLGYMPDFF